MYKVGYDYIVKLPDAGLAVSTAKTIVQIKAGNALLEILEIYYSQGLVEVSTQEQLQFLLKSGAATVTSFTPRKTKTSDPAALAVGGTTSTGYDASAEGTDGEVKIDRGFNIVGDGLIWVPDKMRIFLEAGEIGALKFPVAPAAHTARGYLAVREYR